MCISLKTNKTKQKTTETPWIQSEQKHSQSLIELPFHKGHSKHLNSTNSWDLTHVLTQSWIIQYSTK